MLTKTPRLLRAGIMATALLAVASVPGVAMAANTGSPPQIAMETSDARGPHGAQHHAAIAEKLGVTPEALRAAINEAKQAAGETDRAVGREAHEEWKQRYLAALAARLGVDVERLSAALNPARLDGIKPLRPAGVTVSPHIEALADRLGVSAEALQQALQQARADAAALPPGTDPERRHAYYLEALTKIAARLGIPVEALQGALHPGAAAGERPTPSYDAIIERLRLLVAEGKLSEERAAAIIERLEAGGGIGSLRGMIERTSRGGVDTEALRERLEHRLKQAHEQRGHSSRAHIR